MVICLYFVFFELVRNVFVYYVFGVIFIED